MASFWKDSIGQSDPYAFYAYAYYTAEAAKLENSEKSLTFAARLFLDNLRGLEEPSLKTLMADQAKVLFKKVLEVNPANDSAKIGLGSCYIFGSSAENPGEICREFSKYWKCPRRDSTNMYAQLMLGIGGMVSGQLDKAVERLLKVVENQPHNLEAILTLAEAYERKGDKAGAVKWYTAAKNKLSIPQWLKKLINA
jgi:tetratricopeptide (TPR) repeat protein